MAKIPDTQSQIASASHPATTPPCLPEADIILRSEELFAAKTEIVILHNGERYRLRLTRRGKLILQK